MNEKFETYDEKNKDYRDEILTRIDSFAKRIVDLEEEGEVGTYQAEKLRKTSRFTRRILFERSEN